MKTQTAFKKGSARQPQRTPTRRTTSQITISLPPELLKYTEDRAEQLGITRAVYVQQLVRGDMVNAGNPLLLYPIAPKSVRRKR